MPPWLEFMGLGPGRLEPLENLIEAGGSVLVVIVLVAMVLFSLALERVWYYRITYRRGRRLLIERWTAREKHLGWSALTLRNIWADELISRLRRPLPWLRLLVALCPLLGLLGTVTGMIAVFDSLALSDTSQARAMADGVARAILPTLTGMAVAVVGLLFTSRFEHVIRREEQRLHDRLARAVEESNA